MNRVVHLTSVHTLSDPRVFLKECKSLAAAGYDVTLVVPHERDELRDGVRVRAVPLPRNRAARMTRTVWQVYRAAVSENASLYHFHDPELIPVGLLLKLQGAQVIYDVHEDYVTSIRQKTYLPKLMRLPLAHMWSALDRVVGRIFPTILAERYYLRNFPMGTLVLNYPTTTRLGALEAAPPPPERIRLLYTGTVSEDRGALIHASLVHLRDDLEVHIIGRCSARLADEMRRVAGQHKDRLHIVGEGYHVPFERIVEAYWVGGWTAGLALFPSTPHYREKELTKFFEYMAAGIPVICSDFPVWRELMEAVGCGFSVDPNRRADVSDVIQRLSRDPEKGRAMGARGQAAVEDHYNWTCQARTLLDFYRTLIGSPQEKVSRTRMAALNSD